MSQSHLQPILVTPKSPPIRLDFNGDSVTLSVDQFRGTACLDCGKKTDNITFPPPKPRPCGCLTAKQENFTIWRVFANFNDTGPRSERMAMRGSRMILEVFSRQNYSQLIWRPIKMAAPLDEGTWKPPFSWPDVPDTHARNVVFRTALTDPEKTFTGLSPDRLAAGRPVTRPGSPLRPGPRATLTPSTARKPLALATGSTYHVNTSQTRELPLPPSLDGTAGNLSPKRASPADHYSTDTSMATRQKCEPPSPSQASSPGTPMPDPGARGSNGAIQTQAAHTDSGGPEEKME